MDSTPAERLKLARLSCGYRSARDAAAAMGWNVNTYASNENGNAPFSHRKAREYADAFGVRWEWLLVGQGTAHRASPPPAPRPAAPPIAEPALPPAVRREIVDAPQTPIIGTVGADPDCVVQFADEHSVGETVPPPPGGTRNAVALRVAGYGLHGFAELGAILYFDDQRLRPSKDMINQVVVVVETMAGEVMVGRLHRGGSRGVLDFYSLGGPCRLDCKVRWAAPIIAIIPPHQARRILTAANPAIGRAPAKLETSADGDGST